MAISQLQEFSWHCDFKSNAITEECVVWDESSLHQQLKFHYAEYLATSFVQKALKKNKNPAIFFAKHCRAVTREKRRMMQQNPRTDKPLSPVDPRVIAMSQGKLEHILLAVIHL